MISVNGQDIICISSSYWDFPWGSKQEIMSRLSRGNRVLFIEYQSSALHLFRYSLIRKRYINRQGRINKINKNLYVYSPLPNLPFGNYYAFINRINQWFLKQMLKPILNELQFKNPILWLNNPCSFELIGKINLKKIIYHCIDDFVAEKKNQRRQRTMLAFENQLIERADIIFASSRALYDRHIRINTNTYLLPSGVDERFIKQGLENKTIRLPEDISSIPNPRIGVLGLFGEKLDTQLIEYIAGLKQDWSIILIGPVLLRKILNLSKYKNVYFLGMKNKEEIPLYIRALDVCLIPYKLNDFTKAVSPLKLFEYLALGKPVVATTLPDLEEYNGLIKIAAAKEDFARCINDCLEERQEAIVEARIRIASENTWDKRLEKSSQIISNYL
jgi:glycosyltransferase involved in cell wall biosynthesis